MNYSFTFKLFVTMELDQFSSSIDIQTEARFVKPKSHVHPKIWLNYTFHSMVR